MTTKYYLGFKASDTLAQSAGQVLINRDSGGAQPYAPMAKEIVKLFVPELLDAFLIKVADAIGLSHAAAKIVHGAADTIAKASSALIVKLLAKRSNAELEKMVQFIDETYLRAASCSIGEDGCGCEISHTLYEKMKYLVGEMQNGNIRDIQQELHDTMLETVDVVIDGFMLRAIRTIELNFVLRKLCDATVATCRGAGHMVVNKVFKHLDDDELVRLAHYFDGLIVTADREAV